MQRGKTFWILAFTAAVLTAFESTETAKVMMEAARKKEVVDGNLSGAIKQYAAIVAKYKNDRATGAMALVHMAECYQKMGDAESRKIYEQVVRDYGDQKDAVTIARAKLGAGVANSGVITRQMWSGPKVDSYGGLSADGRFLSYTDWETGDLALHDFTTGQDRHLTNKGTWADSRWMAIQSVISRDGRQVAYEWHDGEAVFELRLLDLGSGSSRVMVPNIPGKEIVPQDWSFDGKWIAVAVLVSNEAPQPGLVSAADGSLRVLSAQGKVSGRPRFSPDGKYLACDVEAKGHTEVRLLAVNGGGETTVLAESANDRVLGWSPEGGHLIFGSDRSGLNGVWALPIADGKTRGTPELIKANINAVSVGVTRSGALYYSSIASGRDVYVASVDLESGNLLSPPAPVAHSYLGLNDFPRWSPDGKYLAYFAKRDANDRSKRLNVLAILSAETGEVRELNPDLRQLNSAGNFSQPIWSPDGGSLLVNGTDKEGHAGIYRIDVHNGKPIPVVLSDPRSQSVIAQAWLPDGSTIYMGKKDVKSNAWTLVAHNLESGQERELLRRDGLGFAAVSPDGRLIALTAFDNATKSGSLLVVPVEGGASRELFRASYSSPEQLGIWAEWTPDGKFVIFRKGDQTVGRETYRIPLQGGTPVKYGNEWTPGPHSINPDGRRVAFPLGEHRIEIWAMENFLPKGK
jgi:Tol biopolymer transport system component